MRDRDTWKIAAGVAVGVPPAVKGVRLAARIGHVIKRGAWVGPVPPGGTPALRRAGRPPLH
jgi:hypothetical protein